MNKSIIQTDNAPAPIGPYSQAVQCGQLLFISGQIALHPQNGNLVTEDIHAETRQVMENLQAILSAAGLGFSHVVKASIFLSDMELFSQVNEVYGTFFKENFPARETIAVKGLPRNVHIEISMIASL